MKKYKKKIDTNIRNEQKNAEKSKVIKKSIVWYLQKERFGVLF